MGREIVLDPIYIGFIILRYSTYSKLLPLTKLYNIYLYILD
jgi:hypothetical protein